MTVQEMLDIAGRCFTSMADAMIRACVDWSVRNKQPLRIPERGHAPRLAERRPPDEPTDEEWRRLVEGNSDTRHQHV